MELLEIPTWAIWTGIVAVAFVVGLGIGYFLKGPEKWRPSRFGV